MVGFFFSATSTIVGSFYFKVGLTITVSNYMQSKNSIFTTILNRKTLSFVFSHRLLRSFEINNNL